MSQEEVLILLRKNNDKKGLTSRMIREELRISQNSVSNNIARLLKSGLIGKTKYDKRVYCYFYLRR